MRSVNRCRTNAVLSSESKLASAKSQRLLHVRTSQTRINTLEALKARGKVDRTTYTINYMHEYKPYLNSDLPALTRLCPSFII